MSTWFLVVFIWTSSGMCIKASEHKTQVACSRQMRQMYSTYSDKDIYYRIDAHCVEVTKED